ncbi:hypothetical protein [Sulfuricurvum sp.]|uniref:hypothetical protein n=1 Tax=Sulfuricurvum sp. TaxID=2025608 RepID=UPI003566C13E
METIRLIEAVLEIAFDRESTDQKSYEHEYATLSESDDDAIGQWLRTAKARGEVGDTDPVVLHLMMELYRKIDRLENLLLENAPKRESLGYKSSIESIGIEHFKLNEPILSEGERYYGRIELPVHPKRETALYFEAVDSCLAKIVRIHPRDEDEWARYMRSRERIMIRHLKGRE